MSTSFEKFIPEYNVGYIGAKGVKLHALYTSNDAVCGNTRDSYFVEGPLTPKDTLEITDCKICSQLLQKWH